MGDTQSAQRDAQKDALEAAECGQAQDNDDSNVEAVHLQNNSNISGRLDGKFDDPLEELNRPLEDDVIDEVCDTESALVSAREEVSDSCVTLDDKEVLLDDVEIHNMTDSDLDGDRAALSEKEDRMNEINNSFRRFFSNISLKLTVKQSADENQAKVATDVSVPPEEEEAPSSPWDTGDMANEGPGEPNETREDNGHHPAAQDSADNESTTCPTVTDMTSEHVQEKADDRSAAATEGDQEPEDAISAIADTDAVAEVVESEVDPGGSPLQNPAEEEVLSPIKVFFTTGIFSSIRRKKKAAEEEKQRNMTNEKEVVDMDREAQAGPEEIGKDLAKDEVYPSAERAVDEDNQKTKDGNEDAILETVPTNDGDGNGENIVNANEEKLSSEENVQVQSTPLQRLLSGRSLKRGSTKQRGRKKSSDSAEGGTHHLQSSERRESAESTTEESPAVAPAEVKKSGGSAWETLKRLLTPKKFQKSSSLSIEEVALSKPEEPKLSEEEEIVDESTDESRKRKDSIVSWDSLLCGSGNRRSRKSSNTDEQKPKTGGDDNRPTIESKHATDPDGSHDMDDNASSPEQGGSHSEDEGSTWRSFKRLVTPKRRSRDGEDTKEQTSDSEIIQDESSFSLKKFIPGRKKRRPSEKQEQVPSDKPDREEHSDEEESETPAVIPLSEFDIPETEGQVKIQAVIESQTAEAEKQKGQEEVTSQTTEAIVLRDGTPAVVKETDTSMALENLTETSPASVEEVEDLAELVSKLQQLSDIPEEGLIEESVATPASLADDAARDDTIADIIEFTSEAVTAQEPVDITVEDETEMLSAVSQLTDSSKTSGNATPVPADYDIKETANLLQQVVKSISDTPNEALVSTCGQSPEIISGSASPQILDKSILKEPTIPKPHQPSDATLPCHTVEVFDAIDSVSEAQCFSDMTDANFTQCLSEDTTEEFYTAGISVDEEVKYIRESKLKLHSSSEGNKAKTSEVSPLAEDLNVAEMSIDDQRKDNQQAIEMAPPGYNEALPFKKEALEVKHDQIKESTTEEESQVQSDETVDESETLTLTDACLSINSEEVSVAQADEMPATSEATPTDETAKGSDLLSAKQMQGVTEHRVGDEEQCELLVVKPNVAEVEHVTLSDPGKPEEVEIKADKSNSPQQSCSSVDMEPAEHGSIQEFESQSITEDIQVQESTIPDSYITSTEREGESVAVERSCHTLFETEMYTKEDSENLHISHFEGGDQTTEATGELQTEQSDEEAFYCCEESNFQALEHKEITDIPVLEDLTEKDLPTGGEEPTEVPQHILVEEDGQKVEVTNDLEDLTPIHVASVNHDCTIQEVEKQVIPQDNAELYQGKNAHPSSSSEVEKEPAAVFEQGTVEKEHIPKADDPCEEPRQVLVQEEGQHTKVTDELQTSVHVGILLSEAILVNDDHVRSEDQGSNAETANTMNTVEDEKDIATHSEQSLWAKELVTVESDLTEELHQISVTDIHVAAVTKEWEASNSEVSVDSNAPIVENLAKQAISEDVTEQDEHSASVTDEVEQETGVLIEQAFVGKNEPVVYNDPKEIHQQSMLNEDFEEMNVSAFEAPSAVQCTPLVSLFSSVEVPEKHLTSEDLLSNAEDANTVITVEVEKQTAQVAEFTKKLEASTSVCVASVDSDAGIINVLEKQVVSEDLGCNAENACTLESVEEHISATPDVQDTEVAKELEAPTFIHVVASLDHNTGIVEVLENQVLSGELTDAASVSETAGDELETWVLTEQEFVVEELPTIDYDPNPQQSVLNDDEADTVLTEFEALPTLNTATLITEPSVVAAIGEQVTYEDQGYNTENANPVITVEECKETITQTEPCLLEKELVIVKSDHIAEPQYISVTDDVQIATVTKELEAPTSFYVACVDYSAGMVEVLEQQDLYEDCVSASMLPEVENEIVVLKEPALVMEELSNFDVDPKEISQRSAVDQDEVVMVVTEFEAPPTLQTAPLMTESSVVEVIGEQVTFKDLGCNTENTNPIVTVEDYKETVTQTEQCLLEKEPVTVESDLNEDPQHISVTDDVQITEVTKELEAPTSVYGTSVVCNADMVEVLEKQDTSEDIKVSDVAYTSTAEVENATVVLTEPALLIKDLDMDLNEISQQGVLKDEVFKVSTEFEAPSTVEITSMNYDSSITDVIEKHVTPEDLGADTEHANTLITAEDKKEKHSEESLLDKELVTVESNLHEEPQHISVMDVQVAEVVKEVEASSLDYVDSVDSKAGIVETFEKKVIFEGFPVLHEALVTAEVENETGVAIDQAVWGKELVPTVDDDTNEIPQKRDFKEDDEVKVSTEIEATPKIAHLMLGSSVEVAEKQLLYEDIPVTDVQNASASTTAEAEEEAAVLMTQVLQEKELVTEVVNPEEVPGNNVLADIPKVLVGSTAVHVASTNSDTGTPQVLEIDVIPEAIPTADTKNTHDSIASDINSQVIPLTERTIVEKEIQTKGDQNEVNTYSAEPSHEVVSTGVNDEVDIDERAEVENNAEVVEDGAPMQGVEGEAIKGADYAAMEAFTWGANRETLNITGLLLDVGETEEEDATELVSDLEQYVPKEKIEMEEESNEDGVTDDKEYMNVCCEVESEVDNASSSWETEEEILDEMEKVTAKEVHQQDNQTQVSEEGAKEDFCLEKEPVLTVEVVATPPSDEQEATETTRSELSEIKAKKITENKSDASIGSPEVPSVTEVGNEEETASIHDKIDLDEPEVKSKNEIGENAIEEDSSYSPELLAAKEKMEGKQWQTNSCYMVTPSNTGIVVPQIIISSENVQPTVDIGVKEIPTTENVESSTQTKVTEFQVKDKGDTTIRSEVTESQVMEKVEQNHQITAELQNKEKVESIIQGEVTELGTEQNSAPQKEIQVSEAEANMPPIIKMEETESPTTEKLESTIKAEFPVTAESGQKIDRPEDVVQAIEAIGLEAIKAEMEKELHVPLIKALSCSPQEVMMKEMTDAKEQTQPCQVVPRSEEGDPSHKLELTEIQLTEKVEPNNQIDISKMKDSSTHPDGPEVGVQAGEVIEKESTIPMAEVPANLREPLFPDAAATLVIEVTKMLREFDSTTMTIRLKPAVLQQQPTGSQAKVTFRSEAVLCNTAVEPSQSTQADLVQIEQEEQTLLTSKLNQPEVGVKTAELVQQGREDLEKEVWLDAEEDVGKQAVSVKAEIDPQKSVESQLECSQDDDDQDVEFLDTSEHAHVEEESSPEEIQAVAGSYQMEHQGEDIPITLDDSQTVNLTETRLICKELD